PRARRGHGEPARGGSRAPGHGLGRDAGGGVPARLQLPARRRRREDDRRVRPPPVVRGAPAVLNAIRDKSEAGKRLDRADGLWLLTAAPLLELGSVAHEARLRRIPAQRVTFGLDSNPNYTNVCITACQFC